MLHDVLMNTIWYDQRSVWRVAPHTMTLSFNASCMSAQLERGHGHQMPLSEGFEKTANLLILLTLYTDFEPVLII